MGKYNIGIYIRLSHADLDLAVKEGKTESESISNQRSLINRFLDGMDVLRGCKREEFFDDGFSGTNFARPSFEKMMEKVKEGGINLIAVKDFSRFGRDYIELGDYLERIFPFMGVRFISVNDGYDSDNYKGTTGGIDVVLKNIVYDYYSKDLSDKVTASKYAIMKRGHFQGGRCPFGYMKSDVKGKMIPDPDTAPVVRRIFDLALQGYNTGKIVQVLTSDNIPTPAEFYQMKHPGTKLFKRIDSPKIWQTNRILAIIQDESYYGAVVQHKRQRVSVGSRHTTAVAKEDQFIVEGMHESIVSKEEWLQVQSIIRPISKRSKYVARDYPLRGVAYCGACHRALQYDGRAKRPYYICQVNKFIETSECYKGKIYEDDLNETVWQSMKAYLSLADELAGKLKRQRKTIGNDAETVKMQIESLQKERRHVESDKYLNMDKFMSGELSKEIFLSRKKAYEDRLIDLDAQISELQKKLEMIHQNNDRDTEEMVSLLKEYSKSIAMTNEMVHAFIESVYITDNEHIEIVWKFKDGFLNLLKDN